jgi:hypothetical protein
MRVSGKKSLKEENRGKVGEMLRKSKFWERFGKVDLRGGVGAAVRLALLVVDLQQAGLGSGPGTDGTEDHGQIVAGLTDGLISGGHQESGGDDHDQRDDGGENVGIDVLHDEFLLEDILVIDEVPVAFSGVLLL